MREADGRPPAGAPDVLVVGGGPAGSVTALLLARAGWHVRLLDRARFPRPKPCAECLNPGAVRALGRLGLLELVEGLGPGVLRGWILRTGEGVEATGTFPETVPPTLCVPRLRLDAALLEEARRAGVEVWEGVRVRKVFPETAGGRAAALVEDDARRPRREEARWIVGADGLRSVTARSLGLIRRPPRLRKVSLTCHVVGVELPPERGLLHLDGEGTVGLAPVAAGADLWNVTVMGPTDLLAGKIGSAPRDFVLRRIRAALPARPGSIRIVAGPWASGPFDWVLRRIGLPGVLLVGDAAGYYDPLTGQGIHRALRSAELAAEAIDRSLRSDGTSGGTARAYAARLHREFEPGRRLQQLLEFGLGRGDRSGTVLRHLAPGSVLLDQLLQVVGDVEPIRTLAKPRIWLSLLRRR